MQIKNTYSLADDVLEVAKLAGEGLAFVACALCAIFLIAVI